MTTYDSNPSPGLSPAGRGVNQRSLAALGRNQTVSIIRGMEDKNVTTLTEIAVAVVEHNGRYLIGRRPAEAVLAGFWEFPGGKVKSGETFSVAAARECLEETGQAVEVVDEFPKRVQHYEHDCVRLHFMRCRPAGDVISPRPPFLWVKREDLSRYRFPEGNQSLLGLLLSD